MHAFSLSPYRLAVTSVILAAFLIPAACGTLQVGVEGTDPPPGSLTPVHTVRQEAPQETPIGSPIPVETAETSSTAPPPALETPIVAGAVPVPGECKNAPMLEGAQPLPNPPDLRWEPVANESGALYRLSGLTSPVISAVPSPDGHWWAVEVVRESVQAGPVSTALLIIDSAGDQHWLASIAGGDELHEFAWLADSRLLWVDNGFLVLGNNTGTERRDLAAPETLYEVWLGANNYALASGQTGLWRLDLATDKWDMVMGLDEVARSGQPPVSFSGANLSMSPDGSFAALMISGNLLKVPMQPGYPARQLATFEYGGRGGRVQAPRPLADSPYWFPGEMALEAGHNAPAEVVLLDERNGSLRPLADLINIHDQAIFAPLISPDGRWVAVPLAEEAGPAAQAQKPVGITSLYLARSDQLSMGRVVAGQSVLGWLKNPAGVYIAWRSEQSSALTSFLLPDGQAFELISDPDPNSQMSAAATARMAFVGAGNQLHAITPDGALREAFDLYGARVLGAVPPARGLVSGFYTQALGGGQCTFQPALYLWDIR